MIKFQYKKIILSDIQVEPSLTPESLERKDFCSFDRARVKTYQSLLSEMQDIEILKVWDDGRQLVLLENYEYYKALIDLKLDKNREVPCLVLHGDQVADIKRIALKLNNLRSSEQHLSRCIQLKILIDEGVDEFELRNIYGVSKSASPEARKFQRDCRLIRHSQMFSRVLGVDTRLPADEWLTASGRNPTLQYSLALQIISKMPDRDSVIERFDVLYSEYLKDIEGSQIYEDEATKPIFQWSRYNRNHVLDLASTAIREQKDGGYESAILDRNELDRKWAIEHNEATHETHIPSLKINLGSKKTENLKLLLEVLYKTEKVHYSLLSYFRRINPVAHGDPVRVKSSNIAPLYDTSSNAFKFEDLSYFELVRRLKVLHYCNRELLLKSVKLKPHHFGFPNTQPLVRKAYKEINTSFISHLETSKKSILASDSADTGSDLASIYKYICEFLAVKSETIVSVSFSGFIKELFSYVFFKIDAEKMAEDEKVRLFLAQSQKISSSNALERISKTGVGTVTLNELREAAGDLFKEDYRRVSEEIQRLVQMCEKISPSV